MNVNILAVVICPLSVTEGWALEMARFAPKLRVMRYTGNKEERAELRQSICKLVNDQASPARVGSISFISYRTAIPGLTLIELTIRCNLCP